MCAWARHRKACLVSGVIAGLTLAPVAAAAQSLSPGEAAAAARQPEILQRQQQERIDQDQTRILTSPQRQTVIEVPTHERAVAAPGTCQVISRIEFERAPLLDNERRRRLTEPYVGRCLGLGDVENLLSDITRFYIEKGRPTTRVYIKPQSLSQGVLVLDAVEGRVEEVIVDDTAAGSIMGARHGFRKGARALSSRRGKGRDQRCRGAPVLCAEAGSRSRLQTG